MDEEELDDIYLSLQGFLREEYRVPWVENAYAPGSVCKRAYHDMRAAYGRLCDRLGVNIDDGDSDLNDIVEAMETIQEDLSKRMFRLGIRCRDMERK